MIDISDKARSMILKMLEGEKQEGLALRVRVTGRGPGGFQYDLQFVEGEEKAADDHVFDGGGFTVYVDPASEPELRGASLDWVEGAFQSGFKIDNPNPHWSDPTAQAVQEVLDGKVNPGVAGHGGFVNLLDVKGDTAYIQLGGGCQGCGMADVTLKQGIEVMIKEAVPAIKKVIDSTDHAGGTNPYYQPSKGGGPSPLS